MYEDRWLACTIFMSRPAWMPCMPMDVSPISVVIAPVSVMRCGVYICSQGGHAHRDTRYYMRLIYADPTALSPTIAPLVHFFFPSTVPVSRKYVIAYRTTTNPNQPSHSIVPGLVTLECYCEILNLFAKKKRDQLLRAPSVGKHIVQQFNASRRGKKELKSSREKCKARSVVGRGGRRARYVTPDLSYD